MLFCREQAHKLVQRHRLQCTRIAARVEDARDLTAGQVSEQRGFEFSQQNRYALDAPLAMADRKIDRDFFGLAAVGEEHLHRVADVALVDRNSPW